jgi:3-hydroxybutyryl-CoA dehydrogenase
VRLGRKSGRGWYDYAEGAGRPEPHTADKERPPAHVVAEGGLGPAAELLTLIREAGIEVREEDENQGTRLVLPGGGDLVLAVGQTSSEFGDVVYFDLALDYRKATRIALAASQDTSPRTLAEATGLFQALGKDVSVIGDVPGMIVARTVARIIDLAHDAVAKGVATEEDIDTAMRLGVNYPLGPFEWNRGLGRDFAFGILDEMHERDPSGRYAPSLALYRHAYANDRRESTS